MTTTSRAAGAGSAAVTPRRSGQWTYLRFEILRTVRNRRFFLFSLLFPLILYLSVAGSHKDDHIGSLPFPVYYLTGMVSWGTMAAVMAGGARIALERTVGWTRQMRITPLPTSVYFGAKILTGYLVAAVSIVLLYAAGLALGVSLPAAGWFWMTLLILIGLIPFALIGVLIGHLVSSDSMGPALGGITSVFALLGGAWGPLADSGAFHKVVELLPSYWLVQAGQAGFDSRVWPAEGWIVIGVWSLAMLRLARLAYRRDTRRV